MSYEFVKLEWSEGMARLVLNRPPLNVLNIPMMRELQAALEEVAADDQAKVVVITGDGRAFCAGVDVADHTADRVDEMLHLFHAVIRQVMDLEMPVVAALNGAALGGGWELAMACDMVVARDDAKIGQPEIQLAVFPPAAAVLMPRLIGRQRAMELILTGRTITAAEGRQIGLVNQVFPAEEYPSGVDRFVGQLTALSRPVLRLTKRAVKEGLELGVGPALELTEAIYLSELMRLEDPHEGLAAFMEKRKPVWKNQ
ncbi:MAG: enoyl-CoA hydratase [Chloroflexi bacterium]|nr:MAG: enoyl-CoA hydratase [Chloroflexota bacterium]